LKSTQFFTTNFKDTNKHIIFKRKIFNENQQPTNSPDDFELNAKSTLIFVDLDDTFLTHEGRADGTQSLLDPSALDYIERWIEAGYSVAFLTSRDETERAVTQQNLKTVGINPAWKIPLFITGLKQKKGTWLVNHQSELLQKYDTIIHIDDKDHQLQSVQESVCEGLNKRCYLVHFGQKEAFTFTKNEGLPDTSEGFDKQQTTTGGNKATFILRDGGGSKFILKQEAKNPDGTKRTAQFKEEILADAIYATIGKSQPAFNIHIAPFKVVYKNNDYQRISDFLQGDALGIKQQDEVAKGFIVDVFMANWDLLVGGKNLWLSGTSIYRLDNGGSLRYRAIGELKSTLGYDFSSARCDIDTLRGKPCSSNPSLDISNDGAKFYGALDENDILNQIEMLVPLKDQILQTADEWQEKLDIPNYEELRSNLSSRLNSLKEYYYDNPRVLSRYERSHPFRMVAPDKSSASILIVSYDDNNHPKILLGKRVRHDWWGNFGGKADDTDGTLLNTALREVKEESMGEYIFLKDDLLKSPSHDLLKGGNNPDALHRMYWVKADYKDVAIFKEKLNQQTDQHSKEYTDFVWVDVADLLSMVENNLNTSNNPQAENLYRVNEISIHHPLMDMFRQEPVLNWLRALVKNEPVRVISTQGSQGAALSQKEIRKDLEAKKIALRRNIANNPPISSIYKQTQKQLKRIKEIESLPARYPTPAFYDPRSEKLEKLHTLTTSHMDILTAMKERAANNIEENQQKFKEKHASLSGHYPSHPAKSATDAYLEVTLGEDYQPFNDKQNIYNFLRKHSSLARGYAEDFSSLTPPCGTETSYKCVLINAMKKERDMQNWFVFYHTLPGKLAFLYDIFTEFRNVLRLKGSINMHSLRAFDRFFKGLENIDQFISDEMQKQGHSTFKSINNYSGTFQEKGLSTNVFLFGNPNEVTSSSFNMFHDNKTIKPPNYEALLRVLLSELGLTDTAKYVELFNRYFGKTEKIKNNSENNEETGENHLLQIFIHPDVVDDMVYLAGSLGVGLYDKWDEQKKMISPKKFLSLLRQNPLQAQNFLEDLKNEKGTLQRLQARVFMKPEWMTDEKKVQIVRYTKNPLSEKYKKELKEMVRSDIEQWVDKKYAVQNDTLENPSQEGIGQSLPPLQKVYRHLETAEGLSFTTKTPEELYGQFLINDNVMGIKQILARNPNFEIFKPIKNPQYSQKNQGSSRVKKRPEENISPFEFLVKSPHILSYLAENDTFAKQLISQLETQIPGLIVSGMNARLEPIINYTHSLKILYDILKKDKRLTLEANNKITSALENLIIKINAYKPKLGRSSTNLTWDDKVEYIKLLKMMSKWIEELFYDGVLPYRPALLLLQNNLLEDTDRNDLYTAAEQTLTPNNADAFKNFMVNTIKDFNNQGQPVLVPAEGIDLVIAAFNKNIVLPAYEYGQLFRGASLPLKESFMTIWANLKAIYSGDYYLERWEDILKNQQTFR
jgi:hypothetical protein